MAKYLVTDGQAEVEIEATSREEAAQEYVDGGEWGDIEQTEWVTVYVKSRRGESTHHKITLHPEEPDCVGDKDHKWESPYEVVGGLRENPGVWGHGGGVIFAEVCAHCGRYRKTDTWAQDGVDGEQGLRSLSYRDPDEVSLRWIKKE